MSELAVSDVHHHLEKRTAFPGADSLTLFRQLFGTDVILNFAAVSFTLTLWRTLGQIAAGTLYHAILPSTRGELRRRLTDLDFLHDPQKLAFSVWLNPAIWLFIMTGRIVIDCLLYGVEDTFTGLRSKTFKQLFDFVLSDPISRAFQGRVIFEGISLIFGWTLIRLAGEAIRNNVGNNRRRKRRELAGAEDIEKEYKRIVRELEEEES